MAKQSRVSIDLIESVYKREAYVIQCFIAFSINCGENPALRDFSLATPMKFGIGEQDAKDDKIVDLLKSDYITWIAAVGFGQLADLLSLYLDDVYILLSMYGLVGGKRTNILKDYRDFTKKSLNEKIKVLEDMYSLGSTYTDVIASMTKIRNCIMHRRGIVGNADLNEPGRATLRWKGVDLTITGPKSGKVPPEQRGPALTETGDALLIEVVMKEKSFKVGEKISLNPQEVGEIFWSASGVVQDLSDAVKESIKRSITPQGNRGNIVHWPNTALHVVSAMTGLKGMLLQRSPTRCLRPT